MVCSTTLLGLLLYSAAFCSSRTLDPRAVAASYNSDLLNVAPINHSANESSQVMLNVPFPEFEAGSVRCDSVLFVDFPGYLSCKNAILAIPLDVSPRTVGRRGSTAWHYQLPFRILSCK